MTTPALSYLRVSGLGQVEGDGFARQREAVAEWAAATGHEIIAEYRDEGVSGTTEFDDREGLAQLMAHVQSNGVRTVVVERMDRLARDLLVSETILAEFRRAGVRVVSADGGVDLTVGSADPTAVFIRQVLGAVAQLEKTMVVAKLAAARRRKRKRDGRCEGPKPFGELAGEAEALERIRQLTSEGLSCRAIAEQLEREAVPTRSGRPWHTRSVYGIRERIWREAVDVTRKAMADRQASAGENPAGEH